MYSLILKICAPHLQQQVVHRTNVQDQHAIDHSLERRCTQDPSRDSTSTPFGLGTLPNLLPACRLTTLQASYLC